jgi:hypothetical protein
MKIQNKKVNELPVLKICELKNIWFKAANNILIKNNFKGTSSCDI